MTQPETPTQPERIPPRRRNLPLPGVAAIACLLLLESGMSAYALLPLMERRDARVVPVAIGVMLLFAGGAGLLRQKRWGWALSLAAALLNGCGALYLTLRMHALGWLFLAVLYMVFFLYLVRPAVRARMR